METIWKVYKENERLQKNLSSELGVTPLFAQLLVNRGLNTPEAAQEFLFGDMSFCSDPFLMKDMKKSVDRIKEAIDKKEKILIYGDYDVARLLEMLRDRTMTGMSPAATIISDGVAASRKRSSWARR